MIPRTAHPQRARSAVTLSPDGSRKSRRIDTLARAGLFIAIAATPVALHIFEMDSLPMATCATRHG